MITITLQPRKFTYTRITSAPVEGETFRTFTEIQETIIAHSNNIQQAQEGLTVAFYEFDSLGNPHIIKIITRVIEVDNGVIENSQI